TFNQPRYFSGLWGSGTLPVVARAVAHGFWGGSGTGILILDPSAKDSLNADRTRSVTVTGGARVILDSHNSGAAGAPGGGGLTATTFEITGGSPGTLTGPIPPGVPPPPAPLRYLPVPSMPPAGNMTKTSLGTGNHQYILSPGSYNNLPNFQSG